MTTKERLTYLKDEVNKNWDFFKGLHPDSEYFKTYMDLIRERLNLIKFNDPNYNPYWLSAYQTHKDKYWNSMRIRVGNELSKMELDCSIELQIADPGIYHSFKHRNLLLEFILN